VSEAGQVRNGGGLGRGGPSGAGRAPLIRAGGGKRSGGGRTGRSAEEAGVSSLLEMMVGGKGLAEALFFHDDKACAVRESPFLIEPTLVKLPGSEEVGMRDGEDRDAPGREDRIHESDDGRSVRGTCQAVGHFRQHIVRRKIRDSF